MKKKIIFFDGDGTLWYPKATKRTQKPHWVYYDVATKDNYLEHLALTPGTRETLTWLKENDAILVVLSASPYDEKAAVREINERLNYFELSGLFDAVRASDGSNPAGKAAIMLEVIASFGLEKHDAIMVGDSYFYDYLAAKEVGIDAVFIENEVAKKPEEMPADLQSIKEIHDLLAAGMIR